MNPELFKPAGAPNGGVIIVAHGSDGLVDNERGKWKTMMREYATELSGRGFVVLVPDYFALTGTKPPTNPDEFALHRDTWQNALATVISDAATPKGIDPSRVGLLGFSLGGHLMLRLRSMGKVLVSYFAPEFLELGGLGPVNSCPLRALLHHGTGDTLVPFVPNAGDIEQTLRKEKAEVELIPYDRAGHGFVGGDPANTDASTKSKASTMEFFGKYL